MVIFIRSYMKVLRVWLLIILVLWSSFNVRKTFAGDRYQTIPTEPPPTSTVAATHTGNPLPTNTYPPTSLPTRATEIIVNPTGPVLPASTTVEVIASPSNQPSVTAEQKSKTIPTLPPYPTTTPTKVHIIQVTNTPFPKPLDEGKTSKMGIGLVVAVLSLFALGIIIWWLIGRKRGSDKSSEE